MLCRAGRVAAGAFRSLDGRVPRAGVMKHPLQVSIGEYRATVVEHDMAPLSGIRSIETRFLPAGRE